MRTILARFPIMDHLLDRLYVVIDIVDDSFDCHHIIVDVVCNHQVSRYCHQCLFFCERIQSFKSILDLRTSDQPRQNRFWDHS